MSTSIAVRRTIRLRLRPHTVIMPRPLRRLVNSLPCLLLACALLVCALPLALRTQAQTDGAAQGSITGHVLDETGQPIANAHVFASSPGRGLLATSDIEGNFKLDNLARGVYSISVSAPGYFNPAALVTERDERSYYRPGDSVTLRLRKGGVITGRVTDAGGEPLAAIRVSVLRVHALDGRPALNALARVSPLERATDDRGIYRFYGLPPGVYTVAAGGRGATG